MATAHARQSAMGSSASLNVSSRRTETSYQGNRRRGPAPKSMADATGNTGGGGWSIGKFDITELRVILGDPEVGELEQTAGLPLAAVARPNGLGGPLLMVGWGSKSTAVGIMIPTAHRERLSVELDRRSPSASEQRPVAVRHALAIPVRS
jgi:hypothetical protein